MKKCVKNMVSNEIILGYVNFIEGKEIYFLFL